MSFIAKEQRSNETSFINLIYYYKNPNLSPKNFIGFKGPIHIYSNIKNGETSIKKIGKNQN